MSLSKRLQSGPEIARNEEDSMSFLKTIGPNCLSAFVLALPAAWDRNPSIMRAINSARGSAGLALLNSPYAVF